MEAHTEDTSEAQFAAAWAQGETYGRALALMTNAIAPPCEWLRR